MKTTMSTRITRTPLFAARSMFTQPKLIVSLALALFATAASTDPLVYVVTLFQPFGTVDLTTGAFHQIGPSTPEAQANLVRD